MLKKADDMINRRIIFVNIKTAQASYVLVFNNI